MKKNLLVCALALAWSGLPAFALEGKEAFRDDWFMACDNTGTCRVAGYQLEYDPARKIDPAPVSVLLTRAAGEDSAVQAQVSALPKDDRTPVPAALSLRINGKDLGTITLSQAIGTLSASQTEALVAAVREGRQSVIAFRDDKQEWLLSANGGGAMLLAMDSFQKRIGKPSSLASPGPNEGPVLQPQPKPVIKQAPTPAAKADVVETDDARAPALLKLLREADAAMAKRDADEVCMFLEEQERAQYLERDAQKFKRALAITVMLHAVMDRRLSTVRHSYKIGSFDPENGGYTNGAIPVSWRCGAWAIA